MVGIASTASEQPQQPAAAIYCLGGFRLELSGNEVPAWRPSKARSLFQYLVTHRDRSVSRESLIEALWPDPDALAAGTSLKVAVHMLRRALDGFPHHGALSIVSQDAGYRLTTADVWLDVEHFERSYSNARIYEADHREAEALNYYRQAASFYQGDFLADSWDDWVLFRRESLKDQFLLVLDRLANASFASGDYESCLLYSQRLLQQDRCREETYRLLMLCHGKLGQPGRVQRWFELCQAALRQDLDVEPDDETVKIYQNARPAGRRTAPPVAAATVTPIASRDLGTQKQVYRALTRT